jgi:phosphoglucomutase
MKTHDLETSGVSPDAGLPADPGRLVDVPTLVAAYYENQPDSDIRSQRVVFGTSGHRGSSLSRSFNEQHILAITQAICLFRQKHQIDGPLFMGLDTHALSQPAFETALEVLAGNGVTVMISTDDEFTPTPAISHAIVAFNRGLGSGRADGIVITPSHNPPEDGGFKYNPPNGGPALTETTAWIEAKANEILAGTGDVKRIPCEKALRADTTKRHDFLDTYVSDLGNVIDMEAIKGSGLHLAVDALGGAGIHYWPRIREAYGLNLTVLNGDADPTFRFMTYDWDGKIRMDPSSPYAMRSLIGLKDKYDLAFACDTDHDRHGIVTRSEGLMPPNHYLAVAADYLFSHRPEWIPEAGLGKTIVSSGIIDRIAKKNSRRLFETPVGFKWFVDGLCDGALGFAGEESAGASFARRDGQLWTSDKDGIIAALLSAEITAKTGKDPAQLYQALTAEIGGSFYRRSDAAASQADRDTLAAVTPETVAIATLAGQPVDEVLTHAPGDGNAIGGIKIVSAGGWFAARPSGTEDICKIYAESFIDEAHLTLIEAEAHAFVAKVMAAPPVSQPQRKASFR